MLGLSSELQSLQLAPVSATALLFDSRKRPGEAEQVSPWPMGISSAMRMVRIAGIHFSCFFPGVGVAEPPIFLTALTPAEKLSLK